jgi:hypothetical protein
MTAEMNEQAEGMTTEPTGPDPARKERDRPTRGVEIKSGGRTWKLAELGLARAVTEQRDRLHDDICLYSEVNLKEIRTCAWLALEANYNLTPEETMTIIEGTDPSELTEAVVKSVFVHETEQAEETYTNWAKSSLMANGIDPATTPKAMISHILRQLVATGRAMKLEDFTASGQHSRLKESLMGQI